MVEEEKDKSTLPEPIFVGSGPEGERAAEFFLTFADWILGDEMGLLGPLEGDLSDWLAELAKKPVQFERHEPLSHNTGAIFQEAMKEALAMVVDPSEKREKQITDLIGSVSPRDLQRIVEALKGGKVGEANKIRSEVVEKLHSQKRIPPESIPAFAALVKRGRAAQVVALC